MGKHKYYALWLSLICIVIFVIQISFEGFTGLFLLDRGVFGGEVWRFVSGIFLHGGGGHLLYNLFALALFGSILEKFIGSKKFLIVFFVSGILANIIAVNFYASSLGASGAIFGVLGALVIIKPKMMVWTFGFPMPMFLAGLVWVVGDLVGFLYLVDGVGHMAHLGGIFVGLVFGVVYRERKEVERGMKFVIDEGSVEKWENSFMR